MAKRQPVAGVDYDPDRAMCQDNYEWFTSTGRYEGDGWAESSRRAPERQETCPRCGERIHPDEGGFCEGCFQDYPM